jgi:hypothetical protein
MMNATESNDFGTAIWSIRANDDLPHDHACDALIVSDGEAGRATIQRLTDLPVPYRGELAGGPLTLIVRARDGVPPLQVRYEGFNREGSPQVVGASSLPVAVIVRSAKGIHITGLPGRDATS